ncbi:hypothetical protein GCM10023147_41630 [Tsukamurella soli]|uniref:Transposase DDE domain group 1 n=1 Tax=Tsukamurella soli TaxID=644556 RepID=A0ABP8K827_9ACTN
MSKSTSFYPTPAVDTAGTHIVSHAGAVVLLRTAEKAGLTCGLSAGTRPWRKRSAVHDPGKTLLDPAGRSPWAGTAWRI